MEHHGALIGTICAGLVVAFALGALAHRLRISPLVGYLLAGVAIGPFTPGYVADQGLANQLAELGVILLMFGVGLHFSLHDLLAVRGVAIPGAVGQIAVATLLGMGLAAFLGWSLPGGFIFGLGLSVASTVVLLRALQERRIVESERGRIAVGWLIVEDLAMVLALVLIPTLADLAKGTPPPAALGLIPLDQYGVWGVLGFTIAKLAAFVVLMLLVGRRLIPAILHWVAHTGSRELFRLAVFAIALGVAFGAAALFGVSFALGAFFAGMILSESPLSQRAAQEAIPLRDAFAVLFFVSVGMLFDPNILVKAPLELLATLAIILFGKSLAAYLIVRAFRRPRTTALTISASLAQIGEFSFILAGLGVSLGLMPNDGRDLILAGAIISIVLNPAVFALADHLSPAEPRSPEAAKERPDLQPTRLSGHNVLVGYGRVGGLVGAGLKSSGEFLLVVENEARRAEAAARDGAEVIKGNAAEPEVLGALNLVGAKRLFVAIPEAFEAGQIVEQARAANPALEIVARAHSDAEVEHLSKCGATLTIMGEQEIARSMLDRALKPLPGVDQPAAR
jgi:monovalent cation:H+ antiporter-2, CPA2 family